jgi:hypothetical protein
MLTVLVSLILQMLIALGILMLIWEIAKQNPQSTPSAPRPRHTTRKPTRKEQELITLLYGDAEQAQRLIRLAGSPEQAIKDLVRDRGR